MVVAGGVLDDTGWLDDAPEQTGELIPGRLVWHYWSVANSCRFTWLLFTYANAVMATRASDEYLNAISTIWEH